MSAEAPSLGAPGGLPRLGAALVAARIAFGLALLSVWVRPAALPHYEPLERALRSGPPTAVAMRWYTATGVACLAGALAFAGALALLRSDRVARAVSTPGALFALARLAGLVVALDVCWFGWAMWTQPLAVP